MRHSTLAAFFSNFIALFSEKARTQQLEADISNIEQLLNKLSPEELDNTVIQNGSNRVSRGELLKRSLVLKKTLLETIQTRPEDLMEAAKTISENPELFHQDLHPDNSKETRKLINHFENHKKTSKAARRLLEHAAIHERDLGSVLNILGRKGQTQERQQS